MSANQPIERLQPALLDRLTDLEPDKRTESRDGRMISPRRFQESVLRDLAWLLNAGNFESAEDLEAYPAVRASVLNYGIPEFSGLVAAGMNASAIENAVHRAIVNFEPRLASASLRVSAEIAAHAAVRNAMTFKIQAELWADPMPIALYLRTELDLETGAITVTGG